MVTPRTNRLCPCGCGSELLPHRIVCDAAWATVSANVQFDYQHAASAARRMAAYRTALAVAHQIRDGRSLRQFTRIERRPTMRRGPEPATVGAVKSGYETHKATQPNRGAARTLPPRPGLSPAGDTP
jgi:hypothetical protein